MKHVPPVTKPAWLVAALEVLEAGGAVAVPTESYFALAVDATSKVALDQLFALKNRDLSKGVGLMAPLAGWSACVSQVPAPAARLAAAFWPGPLSLVLPAAPGLDSRLVVDGYVSLRVAGPSLAAELVEAFGRPLTATSANLTGRPPCCTPAEVRAQLPDTEALHVVAGDCPGGAVSTLVRFANDEWQVLRAGAISIERIREYLD